MDSDEGVTTLLNSALKNIDADKVVGCEDRSLDVPDDQDFDEDGDDVDDDYRDDDDDDDDDGKQALSLQCTVNGLQPLHDAIIDPIADLCQGDQLIIVPDLFGSVLCIEHVYPHPHCTLVDQFKTDHRLP